uniref:Aminopeptidase n=1 Tax=Timema genevievae TaxID=629358 RepID=A0A7R9JUQ3_TIMGE|nr:unnamed protein product [Timema genevievae]
MPGWVLDHFHPTLPMSSYLVALVVSDLEGLRVDSNGRLIFKVWSRKQAIGQTQYAGVIGRVRPNRRGGPKILRHMENYYGIPFPLPKLDFVALPDFGFSAMENWGLILFREATMLHEDNISTHLSKQRVATVIGHELAHQWFGNLVTPQWWNDLWLKEGFATYVGNLGVQYVEPEWKMDQMFIKDTVQKALALDALESSHPISVPVDNTNQIRQIFDEISYSKGVALAVDQTADDGEIGLKSQLYRPSGRRELAKIVPTFSKKRCQVVSTTILLAVNPEGRPLVPRSTPVSGACIVRMMSLFLGETTFKAGITNYLQAHKWGNAHQQNLWVSLTQRAHEDHTLPTHVSVREIMETWTLQTGYPVVRVVRGFIPGTAVVTQATPWSVRRVLQTGYPVVSQVSSGDRLPRGQSGYPVVRVVRGFIPGTAVVTQVSSADRLPRGHSGYPVVRVVRGFIPGTAVVSQERFYLLKEDGAGRRSKSKWWVPLTYTSQESPNFNSTIPVLWMENEESVVIDGLPDEKHWLLLNNQLAGFYRVNYDMFNWRLITQNIGTFPTVTRAQLFDDSLNLARAGLLDYSVPMNLAKTLGDEHEYLPWASALQGFGYLFHMLSSSRLYRDFKVGLCSDTIQGLQGGPLFRYNTRTSRWASVQIQYRDFKGFVLSLLERPFGTLGFEEKTSDSQIDIVHRIQILENACNLDHPECVSSAVAKYQWWMDRPSNNPSGGAHVLAHALLTVRVSTGALKRLSARTTRPRTPSRCQRHHSSVIKLTTPQSPTHFWAAASRQARDVGFQPSPVISANQKQVVYCTAIKHGGLREWEFAWRQYSSTNVGSERETLLVALGCSRNLWILNRYLKMMMDESSGIRKQDGALVFTSVANTEKGNQIAFYFLRNNWKELLR